jgi:hypothetical protein
VGGSGSFCWVTGGQLIFMKVAGSASSEISFYLFGDQK